ncbi:transmembrane adenylate cyclase [Agarivorans sp. 1_MG-2023]|uniref:transmembrane adenylate cyclase n=1 Tax=Agarivorans sp. 1_MG-2023 TaxID=3062634 RepID=UPI0026E35A6A|nr:transmembrane adenylate cyclase [Agarivorans sp. 1_MG-2023]MDO6762052.1 transmembrane adenylate cyclase [Agarivorans sp. 1_MG-2023]
MANGKSLDVANQQHQILIREQLERIIESSVFEQSPKMKELLSFLVEQTLQGNGDRLKQFTIAIEIFDRGVDFDHQSDPIVRIQAGRVRRSLDTYYFTEGVNDALYINIPKGRYAPSFKLRSEEDLSPTPAAQTPVTNKAESLSPSLTVLPFLSLAADDQQQFFADGFGEELATELSRFDSLNVVSMYAMGDTNFDIKTAADISQVGKELNVSFITTGTMRALNDKMRIHARLYRADTGQQIWAEKYTCDMSTQDLFDAQDQIIAEIVAELASSFGIIHREIYQSCNHKKVEQLSTYEATLRYRHYLMTLNKEHYQPALAALQQATQQEPEFALAWAMLAVLYIDADRLAMASIPNAVELGFDCARKAVELEANNPECQMALAMAYQSNGDQQGLIAAVNKVVELNPNAAYQVGLAGWALCLAGEFNQGRALLASSKALNPFRPPWFALADILYFYSEQDFDQALKALDQFSLSQLYWQPLLRTILHLEKGEYAQAKSAYLKVLELCPDFKQAREQYLSAYIVCPKLKQQMLASLDRL